MKLASIAPGAGRGDQPLPGNWLAGGKLFATGKHCIDQGQSSFSKK